MMQKLLMHQTISQSISPLVARYLPLIPENQTCSMKNRQTVIALDMCSSTRLHFAGGGIPEDKVLAIRNVSRAESSMVIETHLANILGVSVEKILPLKFAKSGKHCGSFFAVIDQNKGEEHIEKFRAASKPPAFRPAIIEHYNPLWSYFKTADENKTRLALKKMFKC